MLWGAGKADGGAVGVSWNHLLFFTNQVAATRAAHARGVHRLGRDVEAVSWTVSLGSAMDGDRHLAVEDDVRCFAGMHVVGIEGVGTILPDISSSKALGTKLFFECRFVHDRISPEILNPQAAL